MVNHDKFETTSFSGERAYARTLDFRIHNGKLTDFQIHHECRPTYNISGYLHCH